MGADPINEGTAEGLQQFLDYTVDKGYGVRGAVEPLKIAARKVFSTVEGEDWTSLDVKSLDVDEYMHRFANMARGDLKHESVVAYRRRLTRAVEAYRKWLTDGKPPSFATAQQRPSADKGNGTKGKAPKPKPSATATRSSGTTNGGDVEYLFPLHGGRLARVTAPAKGINKADAERLSTFVRMLHVEPQGQIPAKTSEPEAA